MSEPPAESEAADSRPLASRLADRGATFRMLLYAVCVLTDFAVFVVIFTASRSLAEGDAEPMYLGIAGAGLSFFAGVCSILGGWLAHRFDGRGVFLFGTGAIVLAIVACATTPPATGWFLASYWGLGIGLGCLYPPLIAWLNRGEDPHTNHSGVSRRLILFCIAWNFGMMCGQLTGGSLFALGADWAYGASLTAGVLNFVLASCAVVRLSQVPSRPAAGPAIDPKLLETARAFKRLSWLANLGGMFGGSLVIHLLPDLAVMIGIAPGEHGTLLAAWRGVIIATYLLMHWSGFWHYRLTPAIVSQILGGVGLVLISVAHSFGTLFVGLTLLGQLVGYNYFSGLFYSAAGSAHERRALAAGIHEATLAAGMAVGTIAGGVLGTLVNHRLPYLLAAGAVVVLAVAQTIAWWLWVGKPHLPQSPE